jgi:signal transduction histidine kinase
LGAEVALASACGLCFFVLLAVPLAVADSRLLPVLLLGVAGIAALVAMFRFWGVAYAVPAAIAGLLAFDWFYIPPLHPHAFPDTESFADLLVYLAVGVLIGELAARAGRRADTSELARSELADEQAALRRVATLVAEGSPPPEVFAAVTEEVGQLLPVDFALMGRYENDETITSIAVWGTSLPPFPIGGRWALGGQNVSTAVARTGRPVRIDHYGDASGEISAVGQERGFGSVVGTPIIVDGRLWGQMTVGSTRPEPPLPAGTEARLEQFTELLETAVANAESRARLARLAEEQAALRQVATLVAEGVPPSRLFEAVAAHAGRLLGADLASLLRYEGDDNVTPVAMWAAAGDPPEIGGSWPLGGIGSAETIAKTMRVDDWERVPGPIAVFAREQLGVVSTVGSPILVEGRLWGVLSVHSTEAEPFPPDTEDRIEEFTQLVATAISNTQARSELSASRARIVAATDQERRRVVRDLHDGAQQRLVHTVVTLKMASQALEDKPEDASELLQEALEHGEQATDELRELAHGIMPSVLTRGGLRAGVGALAARMPVPVDAGVSVERLPPAVEATAYFIVAEALTNVAKHSRADRAEVTARVENGTLHLQVRDDGIGGANADGSGLVGLADRVAALEGTWRLQSLDGEGTLVAVDLPVR